MNGSDYRGKTVGPFCFETVGTLYFYPTGPYSVTQISGLEPGTVYAVRVAAKGVDGRYGDLSGVVTAEMYTNKGIYSFIYN